MTTIKNKSTGTEVKILQVFLGVGVDGKFGPKTAAALNNWKEQLGMNPNGEMTEADWIMLSKTLPAIRKGDKNKFVKMWQLFLGVDSDGIFGSGTKASTVAYQSTVGLIPDGAVGSATWQTAFRGESQKNTTSSTSTSNTPGKKNVQPKNFKQYDSKWGSVVYTKNGTYNKKQTIRNSGCGPTSMADIVATWWDSSATPKTLAALSVSKGYRTTNSGTSWGFFKYCAQKYGASKFVQTASFATAEAAIKDGAYVVCSMKPGLWTKGGHFICWWWVDGTYVYVNDPASASSARAKAKKNLMKAQCKQYFIFYK